jgi:uncharacterized membrane protein YgcG
MVQGRWGTLVRARQGSVCSRLAQARVGRSGRDRWLVAGPSRHGADARSGRLMKEANGTRRGRRRAAASIAIATMLALAVSACSAVGGSPTQGSLPSAIPMPSDALVVVGQGGGYDGGDLLYAFSSSRDPAATLAAYTAQLEVAGYAAAGHDGAWVLFRKGTLVIAVRSGPGGPPTDLLVRLLPAADGMPGAAATPGTGAVNGNPNPGANGNPAAGSKSNGNAGSGAGGNSNPAAGSKNGGGSAGGGHPNPGANGSPNPGANASASPGTRDGANGNADPGANANPGSNANPNPGANGNPGSNANPNPGANGNPAPGSNGNTSASPAAVLVPAPGSASIQFGE